MTAVDPRTPVLVGAGQLNGREHGTEPIDLMSRCSQAAFDDSGAGDALRSRIEAVRVVWGVWPYRDPGRLVAERIGTRDARTTLTTGGGNEVYDLAIDTARRIRDGELDAAVICAAETQRTRRTDRRAGRRSDYLPERDDAAPDDRFGTHQPYNTDAESELGLDIVVRFYAMAETALRHRLGETVDEHRRRVGALWARCSEIAAENPHAWLRTPLGAEEITTASDRNRPIASPYTKLMTSNLNVDQGGAVVMCSAATAEAAGVPRDRWVFPWAGASAADHWFPTNRWAFDESPAMRLVGHTVQRLAAVDLDDCGLIDLYSCFPVAVQVAQRELGLDPGRDVTITGGMTFAAGPLNCYGILALTRAAELLRDDPTQLAYLTGNGGEFTRHCALVLAGSPSDVGFDAASPQAEVHALPDRPSPTGPAREATLETSTVLFDRDAMPDRAIVAALDADGCRHLAGTDDADTLAELLAADCCGRPVRLDDGIARLG